MSQKNQKQKLEFFHWADELANRLINTHPDQELFTLASGITPSGSVHIGNFREVITVDLVKRALEKRGKKTRFVFSWDDYDVLRKIPQNLPQKLSNGKNLSDYLGIPIDIVPDPHEQEESYAAYHERKFENSLSQVGVFPEFLYQSKKYRALTYGTGVLKAMLARKEIREILNKSRTTPLPEDWYPVSIYCSSCSYNQVVIDSFDDVNLEYHCEKCQHQEKVDVTKAGNIKLLWRVDWPMRWNHEKVDFEPGGKDHSSEGGSYDTAKSISRQVWNYPAPTYLPYDFVLLKGNRGKMSSSKGEVITLEDILKIYEPEIVRWIFASYRNNVDFSISFDSDVIRMYESYDRLERIFYGKEEISEKKKAKQLRIFELSQLDAGQTFPTLRFQPSFRHLVNIAQIQQYQVDKIKDYYQDEIQSEDDLKRLRLRVERVQYWIENYAPEEFTFTLKEDKTPKKTDLRGEYYLALNELVEKLNNGLYLKNDIDVSDDLYSLIEKHELDNKSFFQLIYQKLVGKNQGPKLGKFIKAIQLEKLNYLLSE